MDNIEILKSLLYDGKHTGGFTIWILMFIFVIFSIILFVYIRRRKLIGKVSFARVRVIKKSPFGGAVSFKLRKSGYDTTELVKRVTEAVDKSTSMFDVDVLERGGGVDGVR